MIDLPQKIVCVGLNYRDHAEEQGVELPERPLLFAKWPNTLIGAGDADPHPRHLHAARLRGRARRRDRPPCERRVRRRRARVRRAATSSRTTSRGANLQFSDGQWVRGKSLDTFLPVGDLVPASEVPDPQALPIRAILNGETMQDSNTSNQIFGVAEVISFVSQAITLEPGDLIITGTPAGVGAFRTPPVWLQPGDEITIEIDGVGSITNPVTAA